MKFLHLTWEDVQNLTRSLADKIRRRGFIPEVIVAIGRGGFIPARILCDLLGVKKLVSIGIEYYKDIEERGEEPILVYSMNTDVNNKSILLVDDVSDSGRSLQLAVNHILKKGVTNLMVVTLHYKPWSTFRPDLFVEEIESWIIYPWEILESARIFIRKLRAKGLNNVELLKRLISLGFQLEDIELLLEDV